MIIVPYQPHHYNCLNLRECDLSTISCIGNVGDRLKSIGLYGPAYTGIHNGVVVGIAGVMLFWRGVGEVWLVGSTHLTKCRIDFHKTVMRGLLMVVKGLGMRRLQGIISVNYPDNIKWLKRIGFKYEGTLEKYGADGSDCEMLARLF